MRTGSLKEELGRPLINSIIRQPIFGRSPCDEREIFRQSRARRARAARNKTKCLPPRQCEARGKGPFIGASEFTFSFLFRIRAARDKPFVQNQLQKPLFSPASFSMESLTLRVLEKGAFPTGAEIPTKPGKSSMADTGQCFWTKSATWPPFDFS